MAVKTRMTKQKRLIHKALQQQDGFTSAQDLHADLTAKGETLGLATVYRALQNLEEEGTVDSMSGEGTKTLYRLCEVEHHHHHLVCTKCGSSVEFVSPEIEAEATRLASTHGYSDVSHTMDIFGVCPDCQKA